MIIKQGKTDVNFLAIVIILGVIAGGAIVWEYRQMPQVSEPQNKATEMGKIKKDLALEMELENRQYRKEITIKNLKNSEVLKNFQVSIKLDTSSLVKDKKLPFDCSNIRFTDSDKATDIPYWIESGCGRENTVFWLKIPEIPSGSDKSIYVYYGNENRASSSDFDKVFTKSDGLAGWYYFDSARNAGNAAMYYSGGDEQETGVRDFSGNKNDGGLPHVEHGEDYDMKDNCEGEGCAVFFNNWGWKGEKKGVYFKVPASKFTFDKSKGSIEMWIWPYNLETGQYQRLAIDTNHEIDLGIDPKSNLYFYPAGGAKENYNRMNKPFKKDEWNHVLVTWDLQTKKTVFYINGEKKKNDVENMPEYWNKAAETGDWQFGGTNLNIESTFAGYIDGLRVYNRDLEESEAKAAYRYNSRFARFPAITLGDEELFSSEKVPFKVIGTPLGSTDKIKLTMDYAIPIEDRYYDYPTEGIYEEPATNEKLFLVPKNSADIPVFGTPSHFFPYEGTPTEFNDPYLAVFMGFKISDPELIKSMKVEFKKGYDYDLSRGDSSLIDKYLKKLIPTAYACGPYWGYELAGESEMMFLGEKDGIYWYGFKDPILVDKNTSLMQLYYTPSKKEGKLSLEISGIVFTDKNKNYLRSSISVPMSGKPSDEQSVKPREPMYPDDYPTGDKYLAYLAREEKGFIVFSGNTGAKTLDLSFQNRGEDAIKIDDQSVRNIEDRSLMSKLRDIKIESAEGNIIYSISTENIKSRIVGREIPKDGEIRIPLISLGKLQKDSYYYIAVGLGEKSGSNESTDQNRVIRWVFGNDPYYYPQNRTGSDLNIFRLKVDRSNSLIIEKVGR